MDDNTRCLKDLLEEVKKLRYDLEKTNNQLKELNRIEEDIREIKRKL